VNSSIDQQFVEFVVKSLVGNPDAVQVERRIDEKGVLLELTVDPEDLGRVIGKRGATAQSLRTLLRALGTKNEARYNLKIVDNGEPPAGRPARSDDMASVASDDTAVVDDTSAKPSDDKPIKDDLDEITVPVDRQSDVVSKTRKELEELDDLDL
jgi:uncharacterized protein